MPCFCFSNYKFKLTKLRLSVYLCGSFRVRTMCVIIRKPVRVVGTVFHTHVVGPGGLV